MVMWPHGGSRAVTATMKLHDYSHIASREILCGKLPKLDVAGSNPVGRSKNSRGYGETRNPLAASSDHPVTTATVTAGAVGAAAVSGLRWSVDRLRVHTSLDTVHGDSSPAPPDTGQAGSMGKPSTRTSQGLENAARLPTGLLNGSAKLGAAPGDSFEVRDGLRLVPGVEVYRRRSSAT
jgi:hypothetical protein